VNNKVKGKLMKMTTSNIILNGLMAGVLLATSGCWTQHGNQPGGGGSVGGSVRSSDRPDKIVGSFASDSTNDRVSGKGALLAVSGNGNPVFPLNP